ncbi:hypothetical protein HZC09_02290 [Candidatus Micrarchaeota archaeon]|nr:hypothetical protein [Candidatus Micrarchaeota archaeon]
MELQHIEGEVTEAPVISFSAPQDSLVIALFLLSLYFLFIAQSIVFFAVSFMFLAFLYKPHRLTVNGKYGVSSDVIT